MVKLTKIDGEKLVVNAELIESVNCGTDTLVSLTSGRKLIVRETPDEVVQLVLDYRVQLMRQVSFAGAATVA
ncbi:MAG: flagellar FlbD family protein [bacterium]|nr:flagellar FlbD family protein [bacterium]MBK7189295.1 flagellar FlbD family protein [bacterium]MBK9473369.1 flagellar FlbD family protein [bacterium]